MRAKAVLSHIFLSLVLYNAMALGSAFLLGMQVMLVVIECKGETT